MAVLVCAVQAQPADGSLAAANAALQAGEADKALTLLDSLPASAEQHNLKCRVRFALEQWDAALGECEHAVSMDQNNSRYHMWLARVLGEKAARASFMNAFSTAKRSRAEFETSVRLDGRNADALADLGEFYKSAPGIVGGGTDKAESVATQLDKVDPARAHQLRGWIAEEQKDYATAERELKAAIGVDPHPAFPWMSLTCRRRCRAASRRRSAIGRLGWLSTTARRR
jgi:tetratricopeptide (TPR) repeat protein